MFVLFNIIISISLAIVEVITNISVLRSVYGLAVLVPSLVLVFRRLHDTGRSGWLILIGLIPFIGVIVLLILACLGSDGNNKYGSHLQY